MSGYPDRFVEHYSPTFTKREDDEINRFLKNNPEYRIGAMAFETQGMEKGIMVYYERIDLGK